MWPRMENASDTTRRGGKQSLSGFVSFMTRKDAEEALREFDGYDWGGSILRVGWSKAVPVAAKPKYGASFSPRLYDLVLTWSQFLRRLGRDVVAVDLQVPRMVRLSTTVIVHVPDAPLALLPRKDDVHVAQTSMTTTLQTLLFERWLRKLKLMVPATKLIYSSMSKAMLNMLLCWPR